MINPHQETLDYIASRIDSSLRSLNLSVADAAKVLHPIMEIALTTARGYLYEVKRGKIWYSYDREASQRNKMRWLSIFMYGLGIEEIDDLVTRTRTLYPHFEFPPQSDQQYRLNSRATPPDLLKDLSLDEKMKRLKPRDYSLVERVVDGILRSYP